MAFTIRLAQPKLSLPCRPRSRLLSPGAALRWKNARSSFSGLAKSSSERKFELEAWLVFEVGKNFAEADGDVAELIDFCHMYALEALRLGQAKTVVQLPGEHDQFRYIPLGVGAVISPWNFPAAIMGGMTLASIVSGNTVVLKPSGDSPTIAAKFFKCWKKPVCPTV